MTLKTDFYDGADGFNQKMNDVFDAGVSWVVSNMAQISTELKDNAAKGKKSFTIQIATTFETSNLRLEGTHMNTYLAGITQGLGAEDIYSYECTPALNTDDQSTTYIDLVFTF